ncbi:MAG: ribose-phosphate diphosphokinase [Anaerolineae bacterium]
MNSELKLFAGNSNPALAQKCADALGISLGQAIISSFEDGETQIRIEESVRGADVFVLQSLCAPVNHNLVELLLMIDALRRASAGRMTVVIPYYGYARQEKLTGRDPISAKLVANLITASGADRVLTIDLHAPAIQGFFDIPVDHLQAIPILASYFEGEIEEISPSSVIVVSPDAGGAIRASRFRDRLGASLAIIAKQRFGPENVEILEMVGDVQSKAAIIVDDMITTGGTLLKATEMLLEHGASEIYAAATHPVFAANALERIEKSPLKKVVVTDTIPPPQNEVCKKIDVLSVAPLLAKAISRIHEGRSLSELFR